MHARAQDTDEHSTGATPAFWLHNHPSVIQSSKPRRWKQSLPLGAAVGGVTLSASPTAIRRPRMSPRRREPLGQPEPLGFPYPFQRERVELSEVFPLESRELVILLSLRCTARQRFVSAQAWGVESGACHLFRGSWLRQALGTPWQCWVPAMVWWSFFGIFHKFHGRLRGLTHSEQSWVSLLQWSRTLRRT